MYEYISGKLASITPANAVIDCCGVGYLLDITLNTYSAIQEKAEVRLWVHEVIREDAHLLYGFFTLQERSLFRLLLGVNGVGAATARMMLSSLSVEELTQAIATGDARTVQRVKGVGAKTAGRIVLELQDKVSDTAGQRTAAGINTATHSPAISVKKDETVSALVMLGFPKPAAEKVVNALDGSLTVEEMIKEALKRL
ncbi:MAG: Holliday junction branch migration protein RuvA [Bacteroidales bacterium]|jgi:Holliday junction DNA helicase RuvA|nr:Holliday junction branch migration protein RuvA [Bacteroidales bacterium]